MVGRAVVIPAGTTTIADSRYCAHNDITSVTFPDSLRVIGSAAFAFCSGVKRIDLSKTQVTAIHDQAFLSCLDLVEVILPPTLATIGTLAFCSCDIRALLLPASVAEVGPSAFRACTDLQTVVLEGSSVLFPTSKDGMARQFMRCRALATVSVPDTTVAPTWPNAKYGMFEDCNKTMAELLAAAKPSTQLQFYWKPGHEAYLQCSPVAREAVFAVLLVATRWTHRGQALGSSPAARRSSRATAARVRLALPDLPDEMWFCILRLIRRHELGRAPA